MEQELMSTEGKKFMTIPSAIRDLNVVPNNDLVASKIFGVAHFENKELAFSFILGAESKKAVGLFRSQFYWGCMGILMKNATPQAMIDISNVLIDEDNSLINTEDKQFIISAVTRLKKAVSTSEETEKQIAFQNLIIRCLYASYWGMEEALMDASKMKVKVQDGKIQVVPENALKAEEIILNIIGKGIVDWQYLSDKVDCTLLKYIVSRRFTKSGLVKSFRDCMDPVYRDLMVGKKQWLVNGKSVSTENGDYLFLNPWEFSYEFLEQDLETLISATMLPKKSEFNNLVWNTDKEVTLSKISSIQFPEGNPEVINRKTQYTTGNNLPEYIDFDLHQFGFNVMINMMFHNETVTDNGDIIFEGCEFSLSGTEESFIKLPKLTVLNSLKLSGNNLPWSSELIERESHVEYLYSPRIIALEHCTFHSTKFMGKGKDADYPQDKTLTMKALSFQSWLTYEANMWVINSRKTSRIPFSNPLNSYEVEMIGRYLRSLVSGLQAKPKSEFGIRYLADFVYPEVHKGFKFPYEAKRHLWLSLEACGFDLRATGHGNKGERIGLQRDGEFYGHNTLSLFSPFGLVADKGRLTKSDSTFLKGLEFDTVVDPFSGLRAIDPNQYGYKLQTSLFTVFIQSEIFGKDDCGKSPGDESYLTPSGIKAVSSTKNYWKRCTREEYLKEMEINPENVKFGDSIVIGQTIIDGEIHDIEEPMYMIKEYKPGGTNEYSKLIYGAQGGSVAIPYQTQLIASFKSVKTEQDILKSHVSLQELKDGEFYFVDAIQSALAQQKKGANDNALMALYSQLSEDSKKSLNAEKYLGNLEKLVSVKRSQDSKLGTTHKQYLDLVEKIQSRLQKENKNTEGLMYLYELHPSGNVIKPILDTEGNHAQVFAGFIQIMKAPYEGPQQGKGSYNVLRVGGNSLDPFIKTMVDAEIFKPTQSNIQAWEIARWNIDCFNNWNQKYTKNINYKIGDNNSELEDITEIESLFD